ncbi:MAG: cupin domain-containing protein [Candidatus Moranbacteria bacterium CG10_big_fil_rev_8_21_14_0_10_35_21]|nr:MAG: cupin domain-containing protein [Candidatus Moranbacteria bacterium CG10_big_fil_rev_8_21_14_0_10_35_21]
MFNEKIVDLAKSNSNFRQVLKTGKNSQVVVMSIPAGGEIGMETHDTVDQILVFVEGEGKAILGTEESVVGPEMLTYVLAGTKHNFINTGAGDLKLYTIYSPPQHADGTIHKTKEEADAAE